MKQELTIEASAGPDASVLVAIAATLQPPRPIPSAFVWSVVPDTHGARIWITFPKRFPNARLWSQPSGKSPACAGSCWSAPFIPSCWRATKVAADSSFPSNLIDGAFGPEASLRREVRRVCIALYGPNQAIPFRTAGRLRCLRPVLVARQSSQLLSCRPDANGITDRARAKYAAERGAMHKHGVRIQDPGG